VIKITFRRCNGKYLLGSQANAQAQDSLVYNGRENLDFD
jgi:hypothetical protein